MANLIPFDATGKLPAHLQSFATEGNEFGSQGGGFPMISIKGKVFTISRAGEKTLVTKPGTDDEPAAFLEVVVLNVGPKTGYAKTFYANGYVEGSSAKPDCSSDDGITPNADSQDKQASQCATCPQNAVGSGATQQNPKGKACRASKMLAVAPAGQLNDPMGLKVPGASVVPLAEYGDFLAKRGVKAAGVVTRIGFDYSVAYPALTFKVIGFVTPEMVPEIAQQRESEMVLRIIGDKAAAAAAAGEATPAQAAIAAPKAQPAAAAKPAKPAVKTTSFSASGGDDDLPTTPKTKVKVEGEGDATPAPAAVKAAPPVEVVDGDGMDAALDSLNFDD